MCLKIMKKMIDKGKDKKHVSFQGEFEKSRKHLYIVFTCNLCCCIARYSLILDTLQVLAPVPFHNISVGDAFGLVRPGQVRKEKGRLTEICNAETENRWNHNSERAFLVLFSFARQDDRGLFKCERLGSACRLSTDSESAASQPEVLEMAISHGPQDSRLRVNFEPQRVIGPSYKLVNDQAK